MQEASFVYKPEAASSFSSRYTVRYERCTQIVSRTDRRRASAEEHNVLRFERIARRSERTGYRRQHDGCGALNVVIESENLITIALQNGPRVRRRKVFPLHKAVWQFLLNRLNKLINEVIVGLSANAFMPPPRVPAPRRSKRRDRRRSSCAAGATARAAARTANARR